MNDRIKGYSSNEISQKNVLSSIGDEQPGSSSNLVTTEGAEVKKEGVGAAARRRAMFAKKAGAGAQTVGWFQGQQVVKEEHKKNTEEQ